MIQVNYGYTIFFTVESAGVATAADSTPTATLYRNGSASGVTVTVSTTATTGLYKATFTTDAGWAKTDVLHLVVSATISSTSGYVGVVWDSTGEVDAVMRGTDDAATQTSVDALPSATLTALGTGTWLTEIPWNAAWDTEVQSECNDALVALDLDNALIAQGAVRSVSVDNSHRVHSHVYEMQANTLTASALAADAVAEIQSGLSTVTLAQIGTEVAGRLNSYDGPTKAEMDAAFLAIDGLIDQILEDTNELQINQDNWVTVDISSINTLLSNIPTVAEFEARTLPSDSYFDPATDTVARVSLVDTVTVNTDMVSVDGITVELAKVPKAGETHRYTQIAVDADNKTADVSIGEI